MNCWLSGGYSVSTQMDQMTGFLQMRKWMVQLSEQGCACSQRTKVEEPEIIFNRNRVVHTFHLLRFPSPPHSRWRRLPAPPRVISIRLSRWYLALGVVLCMDCMIKDCPSIDRHSRVVCVCVCVCVCVYIYIYIYIYTHTHTIKKIIYNIYIKKYTEVCLLFNEQWSKNTTRTNKSCSTLR